eukprot:m.343605 g.343605  ORF g.343605 m.343605 type:complete len:101 (+) comp23085_c0_seq1:27-329(+)
MIEDTHRENNNDANTTNAAPIVNPGDSESWKRVNERNVTTIVLMACTKQRNSEPLYKNTDPINIPLVAPLRIKIDAHDHGIEAEAALPKKLPERRTICIK